MTSKEVSQHNSQIESGHIESGQTNSINLIKFCAKFVSQFSGRCEDKNIVFSYFIDPKAPAHVALDPEIFSRQVNGLLDRALKSSAPGENLDLKVERLVSSDSSTSQTKPVDGFKISARNLILEFPASSIQITNGDAKSIPCAAKSIETAKAKLRCLIAEDNIVNQLLLKSLIEGEGHEVYIAQDGTEAFKLYKENQIDFVLMDINMPNISGLEVSRMIRGYEKKVARYAPIIAVSACESAAQETIWAASGINAFIQKPFNRVKLLDTIKSQLEELRIKRPA